MKTKAKSPLPLLFAISLFALFPSLAFGTGLVAIKEQSFHLDSGANIVVYSVLKDSGMSVKIETAKGTFTVEPKKVAGKVEILSALPANITTDSELEPVRKAAKEYRAFSTRFPKSAPMLASHISALENCIKEVESGKARYNGKWMPKDEALTAMQKKEQKPSPAEVVLNQKQEERRAFEKSQHSKGLVEYNGQWMTVDAANKLVIQNAIYVPQQYIKKEKPKTDPTNADKPNNIPIYPPSYGSPPVSSLRRVGGG